MLQILRKASGDVPMARVERASPYFPPEGEWLWIDVLDYTPDEVQEIGLTFGLDERPLEDVMEASELPIVDDYGTYTFAVVHGLAGADDKIQTIELDVFITERALITFHRRPLTSIEWVMEEVQQAPGASAGGPDLLFSRITEASSRRYLPLLDGLDRKIVELEEASIAGDHTIPGEVQALRRDILLLRRVIAPQRDVFQRLGRDGWPAISERARLRFDDTYDHHSRITDSLDTSRALLAAVLDTYRSTVAENLNEVMKVLTVFTAILLPMSVIAALYGMNFAHMPELKWRWGYFALLGVMTLTGLGLWLYFARRGFVRAPRVKAVPKVLGKGLGGLVHLTIAPVRIAGHLIVGEKRPDNSK